MNASRSHPSKRWAIASFVLSGMMVAAFSSSAQNRLLQWRLGRSVNQSTYVGQVACVKCHADVAAKFKHSAMSRALSPAAECGTLRARAPLEFSLQGITYRIERVGDEYSYTVTDGRESLTMPLLWCFGDGVSGNTFVVRHEGVYYETRVSYFSSLGALEVTPGQSRAPSPTLNSALGQPQRPAEIQGCFTCHSTPLPQSTGVAFEKFTPSVQCEACHGPGSAHLGVQQTGNLPSIRQAIFNPARWPTDQMNQQFCGACHRSWETVMQMRDQGGVANVRFQPYRLANSKCYQNADDRRIACITCHDPHSPVIKESRSYDAKCLACHRGGEAMVTAPDKQRTAPACRTAARGCVSCHMAKVEPEGLFFKFTDHHIRIVRPGDPYPR